jgi:hypothetical protein
LSAAACQRTLNRSGTPPGGGPEPKPERGIDMSTFVWILLGAMYLTALIVLGMSTLRKGHYFLFFVGIVFPILWIIGALSGPTPRAAGAG